MKKIITIFSLIIILGISLPVQAAFKPTSKLYFLQPTLESVRLFFTFSKTAKTDYLLELTDRRVAEINTEMATSSVDRYEDHFKKLEKLAGETKNKEQVVEKIITASLRQQEVLSKVYATVPDQAKDAILNAQENSSKNVAAVIENVEGADRAQTYIQRIERIQQSEKANQKQRLEQAPMESSPNSNPSEFAPREIKGTNQINQLNTINSGSVNEAGGGSGQVQPVQPVQLNQPSVVE